MGTGGESDRVTKPSDPVLAAASQVGKFPAELLKFVTEKNWTFARTMPEWPHEYLVRDRVDGGLFERLVEHIRAHGHEGRFYAKVITYYEEAGLLYWTMGAPLHETTIINRCAKEWSYAHRLEQGTLPMPVPRPPRARHDEA